MNSVSYNVHGGVAPVAAAGLVVYIRTTILSSEARLNCEEFGNGAAASSSKPHTKCPGSRVTIFFARGYDNWEKLGHFAAVRDERERERCGTFIFFLSLFLPVPFLDRSTLILFFFLHENASTYAASRKFALRSRGESTFFLRGKNARQTCNDERLGPNGTGGLNFPANFSAATFNVYSSFRGENETRR